MSVTSSRLRQDIYHLMDQVLKTGQPLEVKRRGGTLKIVPQRPASRLTRLVRHDCIAGDPEDLVHIDWSKEWRP